MRDKGNAINWLPPRDSNPDMLIQSQHVILTGRVDAIKEVLNLMGLHSIVEGVTITVVQPSTPAVYPCLQPDSRKSPAEKEQLDALLH